MTHSFFMAVFFTVILFLILDWISVFMNSPRYSNLLARLRFYVGMFLVFNAIGLCLSFVSNN